MIDSIVELVRRQVNGPDDVIDGHGFIVCPVCGERKEREIKTTLRTSGVARVPTPCKCVRERWAREQQEMARSQFKVALDELRRDGVTDPSFLKYTFANDDGGQAAASEVLRRYVDNWEEMRASNTGVMLSGPVGTGKTYLASATANELMEKKLVPACITSFPRLMHLISAAEDKQRFIDRLQRYELMVIDDLGVERNTEYAIEQVYNVVDARARQNKPVIITTNIPTASLRDTADLEHKRIYDRLLLMCPIHLTLVGKSKREELAARKREDALRVLGYGGRQ